MPEPDLLVYVGTYTAPKPHAPGGGGDGILAFALDPASGALRHLATEDGLADPSFLTGSHDGRFLYAVSESDGPGEVGAYAIDRSGGRLTEVNRTASGAPGPCFARLDASGACLMVAHYAGGAVSVLAVRDDGGIAPPAALVAYEDPDGERASHPHAIVALPGNRFVLVPDTGLDRLAIHRLDAARADLAPLDAASTVSLPRGTGPRHPALHPSRAVVYVCNEHASTLTALAFAERGEELALTPMATVATVPDGHDAPNFPADVHVHPSGRFVYVSNRGHDSIAIFAIGDQPSELVPRGHASTGGAGPRSFALTAGGRLMLVANQDSDTIVAFAVDGETGALEPTGAVTDVRTPVCVLPLPA